MLTLYMPFNIFSLFEVIGEKFREKEKDAIKDYLEYLKSQVDFIQKLIKENRCNLIKDIDLDKTLFDLDKTKKKVKSYLNKEKDEEIKKLVDEIYTYLLKYEFSISQLWACNENS